MKIGQGIFAAKLYELECQYGQFQGRMKVCQNEDHRRILEEMRQMRNECDKQGYILEQRMEGCRSRAVYKLAEAQLEYMNRTKELIGSIADDIGGDGTTVEKEAEAKTLYAEYSIDFAVQAMNHALLAALTAIDAQMKCEEQQERKICSR